MSDTSLGFQNPQTVNAQLDGEQVTVGGQNVVRERVEVCGANPTEIARVKNTAAVATDMGLVVRVLDLIGPSGTSAFDPTTQALNVNIVNDLAGSLVQTDGGTITGGQGNIAVLLSLPYSFDGANWQRVTRLQPAIVHNNHQTNSNTTAVNCTTTAAQILAANPARKGLLLQNISTARIFVQFGTNPVGTTGSEVGMSVEANGGSVGFSSLIDTRALNGVVAQAGGAGNFRLLVTEW